MDRFSRTFLPATAEAGLPIPTVSRHAPLFRRVVDAADEVRLVARCRRADRPLAGRYMLLLTGRRLVVTTESRVLRRVRLHLDVPLDRLSNVTWLPNDRWSGLDLAATVDGVRHRLWIGTAHPSQARRLETALGHAFGGLLAGPRAAALVGAR